MPPDGNASPGREPRRRTADTRSGGEPPGARRAGPLPPRGAAAHAARMALDLPALEESFDLIAPRGDDLMDVFYARLFAAAPAVEPLFAGTDLRRQKGMLLGALVLL